MRDMSDFASGERIGDAHYGGFGGRVIVPRDALSVGREVVAGLETIGTPIALASLIASAGPDRLAFSIDLRDGRPLVDTLPTWGTTDPLRIGRTAIDLGIRRLIVLDLARVGTGRGFGTEAMLEALRVLGPIGLELIAGGGVDGPADLDRASGLGLDGVLVGSALRDGRIGPIELRATRGVAPPRCEESRRAAGDKAPAAPADEPPARPAEGS